MTEITLNNLPFDILEKIQTYIDKNDVGYLGLYLITNNQEIINTI